MHSAAFWLFSGGALDSGDGGVVITVGSDGSRSNDPVASKPGVYDVGLATSDFLAALGAPGNQRYWSVAILCDLLRLRRAGAL